MKGSTNKMPQYLLRPLSAITLLAAALAIFSTSADAFAQRQTGESNFYTHETVEGSDLQTNSSYNEARTPDGRYLVRIWRGTGNDVALSVNGGVIIHLGNTQTLYAPTIAWVQSTKFMIGQTGTDKKIYWTIYDAQN